MIPGSFSLCLSELFISLPVGGVANGFLSFLRSLHCSVEGHLVSLLVQSSGGYCCSELSCLSVTMNFCNFIFELLLTCGNTLSVYI